MSEEIKKPFDLGPILPMFGAGVDLGERLGDLAKGQKQLESSLKEVKQDIKELDAKFEAKFDALNAKVEAKIDALDAKFEAKFDAIEAKFEAKIDALDAKVEAKIDALDAKTDKMAYALHRLDERTKTDHTLLIGLWVTVIAGIAIQLFSK